MKKSHSVIVGALVLAAILVFLGVRNVSSGVSEQVSNGGAEAGSLKGWTVSLASVQVSTVDPRTGSDCFVFNGGGSEIYQAFASPVSPKSMRLYAALAQSGIMVVSLSVKYTNGTTYSQEFFVESSTYHEYDLNMGLSQSVAGIYVSCIGIQANHINVDDISLMGYPAGQMTLSLLFILAAIVSVVCGVVGYMVSNKK